jgi:protein TonB
VNAAAWRLGEQLSSPLKHLQRAVRFFSGNWAVAVAAAHYFHFRGVRLLFRRRQMLHPFVSSPIARHDHLAPIFTLSTTAHVGLLVAAVISTAVVRRPHVPVAIVELVRFAEVPFRTAPSALRGSGRTRGRATQDKPTPAAFQLPQLPASFDLVLPDPPAPPEYNYDDAAVEIGNAGVITDDVLGLGIGGGTRLRTPGVYGAYDEIAVERPVAALPGNAKPRYPSRMVSRSIESNFNVTFVVDTTGTVDRNTVELPSSVLQDFASAVREVLFDWRFVPAELGGRRVRQRVLQPFTFRVERGP